MGCSGSKEATNAVVSTESEPTKALAAATAAIEENFPEAAPTAASAASPPPAVTVEAPVIKPVEAPKVDEISEPSTLFVTDVLKASEAPKAPEVVAPVVSNPEILESEVSVEKLISTVTPEVAHSTAVSTTPKGVTTVKEKAASQSFIADVVKTESFTSKAAVSSSPSSTLVTEIEKVVETAPAPKVEAKVEELATPVTETKVAETKAEEVAAVAPLAPTDEPAPAEAPAAPPAKKVGMIFKQGHKVKNWKNRFFVLEDGTLNYYENAQMKDKKGDLALKGIVITVDKSIVKLTSVDSANEKGHTDLILEIKYPNERDEWVKAIQNHIDYYSK